MVDAAHFIGLVAGKAIPSARCRTPTSSRFTTHKVLRGPRGGMIVCKEEHAAKHRQGGVPVHAGRPADARRRGQGGRAQGGACSRSTRPTRAQVIANAQALAEALAAEGMRPVTGGTDTHLALLDLRGIGVTGKDAEARCDAAPDRAEQERDPVRPAAADDRQSGIRVGTPAVTTQGMTEGDMKEIASLIGRAVPRRDGTAAERGPPGCRRAGRQAHPAYPRSSG